MSDLQHLAPSFIVVHGYDDLSAVPMRKISPCQTLVESFYHLQEPPLNVMLKIPHGFKNKMQPTNPNAHTYVNGTDVKTHGYAITQNTFLQ